MTQMGLNYAANNGNGQGQNTLNNMWSQNSKAPVLTQGQRGYKSGSGIAVGPGQSFTQQPIQNIHLKQRRKMEQ